jgi:hypothetical protein
VGEGRAGEGAGVAAAVRRGWDPGAGVGRGWDPGAAAGRGWGPGAGVLLVGMALPYHP